MEKEDLRVTLVLAAAGFFNLWFVRRFCNRSSYIHRDPVWANLPRDLLLKLADGLDLIDLLRFRGVCKEWRAASSTATARVEPYPNHPWLIIHERNSPVCELHNPWTCNHYKTTIPELERTTCLATKHGWLLLFRESAKIFFFAPFSRATIPLPDFPYAEITDHAATFSDPPTSKECTVCGVHRIDDSRVEILVVSRGAGTWKRIECGIGIERFGAAKMAAVSGGDRCFHFWDRDHNTLAYGVEEKKWNTGTTELRRHTEGLRDLKHFVRSGFENWVDLKDDTTFMVCGLSIPTHNFAMGPKKVEASRKPERRHLSGIWIQPLYHAIE